MYLANAAIESPTHTSIVLYSIILVYIPRECLLTYCTLDGKRCVPSYHLYPPFLHILPRTYTFGSRVVSVLDSGAEGPGLKSQSRRCSVTVFGKLFTPIVPLFTKQQN